MADDKPLLVPIAAEALLVNTLVQNKGGPWTSWSMNYDSMHHFESPVPVAFENVGQHLPDPGVHLHWSLPRALSHGVSPGPGRPVCFPYSPNRWLVVRFYPGKNPGDARRLKAWLLLSDYLNPDDGANPFIDPHQSDEGDIQTTKLGKHTPLESWAGEVKDKKNEKKPFLRAVGPGDVTFAAFQPGVKSVYSFFDDATDEGGNALPGNDGSPSLLTYLITGWYSDPEHDPLYGPVASWNDQCEPTRKPWDGQAGWQALLEDLQWKVAKLDDHKTALPSRSLYHALLYDVQWTGIDGKKPPRINSDDPPKGYTKSPDNLTVAVGHTGIDALAALVRANAQKHNDPKGKLEAEALEAFQYNYLQILDQPDGEAQLDLRIRQEWFGSLPGGTLWEVVGVQKDQSSKSLLDRGVVPPPPPLDAAQTEALAKLNRKQQTLDAARRELASLQWELYAAWWMKNRHAKMTAKDRRRFSSYDIDDPSSALDAALQPTSATTLMARVQAQQKTVTDSAKELPDPEDPDSIEKYAANTLKIDTSKLELKPKTMPRFYEPGDPVLMVSGLTPSARQGALSADGHLPCRFADQAVTGVKVTDHGDVSATTKGLDGLIPKPESAHLPAAVSQGLTALSVETFFVDPADAATIVEKGAGVSGDPPLVPISTISDPLAPAFAFARWRQAWSPLFLEWHVTFYPTVMGFVKKQSGEDYAIEDQPDNWPFDFEDWVFDGTDYSWHGGDPKTSLSYIGRTFLTPQAGFTFAARLEKYLEHHPDADLEPVKDLIEKVGEWNFLSQRLSGLNDLMIMRDLSHSHPPDSSVSQQVGQEYNAIPDPTACFQDTDWGNGFPFFFPVRGGFFNFQKLIVVDAFGQVVDLMPKTGKSGNTAGGVWSPVRGRGLEPRRDTQLSGKGLTPIGLVRLPPRVVQAGRLNFRLVSADSDEHETGLWPDSSPVCGWVLPNHLDGGLAVYDAAGLPLGELLLPADMGGGKEVRFIPAPQGTGEIVNAHMRGFVDALTARKDNGAGFENLLQVVDETLWVVDPLGGRHDQNLSVLIGRPLALVRARLSFELHGRPVYNQSWRTVGKPYEANFTKIAFPIRLGSLDLHNDGLMGYFTDTDYETFNSVHAPEGFDYAAGKYLKPIGTTIDQKDNYLQLKFDYPTYTPQYVTLLLDPRAGVHATTGILPTKILNLPEAYFEEALAQMTLTFRTGPILTDPEFVRLPHPAERHGTWTWLQRNRTAPADPTLPATAFTIAPTNIIKANQGARLPPKPPRLLEGWLKFVPEKKEE